ncbi:asialoglycoprotein receptor 1-like [Coregonus clupeaformis]|uniref:C-type lectin domain-containing protein n=1 Tax=Coregonus suidteri TaxID=861788 RepID=A0AAN8M0H6_9TELE|nr:asialoglycoprotein receptor 1-like [Coregonus clupeaformis]
MADTKELRQELIAMDENEDKAWWRPESSHGYGHLLPAGRSQWYLCAALCVTLTLSLSLLILMPSRFGSVDRTLSDLERSVSNLTESVSLHLSKLHEKVGSLEMKLSDLKRSVSNLTESVSFHSSKLPKKGEVGCPDGWYLHNSSCYFFSAYKASWYTARDSCRDMDATLLILTDEEEWGFVNRISNGRYFWLGLSDERTGEWEWVNGSPYIMDRSKWVPGQPDNWAGHSIGGTEDCAHISISGKLNDNHCTVTYPFICKATTNKAEHF